MARLAGVLALISIGALIGGGQGFYVWLGSSEPAKVTCAEYADERPDSKWLHLTDCSPADLDDIVYEERPGGRVSEVYVPLRAPGVSADEPAPIVLATKDADLCRFVEEALDGADKVDLFANRLDELLEGRIEGTVRFGVDLSDKDRDQIAALGGQLADDFVVLSHGTTPLAAHVWGSMLALGLVGLPLAVLAFLRPRRK